MTNSILNLCIIYPSDPFGFKVGGAETFIKGFIKYCPRDIQIEYVGITSNPANYPLKIWTNVQLGDKAFKFFPVFTERNENKKALIPLALRFTAALKTIKFDYSHKILFFNRIEPAILFKNVSSPMLLVVHSDIERQIKHKGSEVFWCWIPWLYFRLERYVFGFMDQIYTVSQSSVVFYQKKYPYLNDRISFLPTWVDNTVFKPVVLPKVVIRKELGYADEDRQGKWFLFVGRLQEAKAPLRLIDTFRFCAQDDPNARLIMIGEGNLQRKVEEYMNRLGLYRQVIFLKGMPQEELVKFYQAADVLLLTSNYEGMPMCVLEALGCGLPVVTTDVGEVRRVVKNGFSGEVVTSFEPTAIVRALEIVLSRPDVYLPENCLEAVKDYNPGQVFKPVYEKIRELSK